jgi:ribosomal protein S18 acetylase RimI-like enzyme
MEITETVIRLLVEDDAAAYVVLRREALLDAPLAFASSPEDDLTANVEATRSQLGRAPDSVIIGAWDSELVGAAGLLRNRHSKAAHKAELWGMYVTESRRRRGIAARLLAAAIAHAHTMEGIAFVDLGVTSSACAAQRLYEGAGFEAWGTEPDALRHEGESVSELHKILALD